MHETCLIIIHDPGMRPGLESNRGPLDECSTTELTLHLIFQISLHASSFRHNAVNLCRFQCVLNISVFFYYNYA